MLQEIIRAFAFIFVAEMGDKTQILAMAFATKYPVKKVLLGIFIGSFLNHGLAVFLGNLLSRYIPVNSLQIIAGFAFVGFALWTLLANDEEDETENKRIRFGPVFTVSLAFFLGELGDKTQLAAITLSTEALYPLAILCGTVSGMVFTGSIGIFIGKKLGEKIPEMAIKLFAAGVFMFFGLIKLLQTLPDHFLTVSNILLFLSVLTLMVFFSVRSLLTKQKNQKPSAFKKRSTELQAYYGRVQNKLRKICLGEDACGDCLGKDCIIGYLKDLVKGDPENLQNQSIVMPDFDPKGLNKQFDKQQLMECLQMTEKILEKQVEDPQKNQLIKIRESLELALNKSNGDDLRCSTAAGTVLIADESLEFWGYNVTRSSRIYLQKKNTKSTQKNNETLNYFFDSQTECRLIPVTLEI